MSSIIVETMIQERICLNYNIHMFHKLLLNNYYAKLTTQAVATIAHGKINCTKQSADDLMF